MAINFPANPVNGQIHIENDKSWQYDTTKAYWIPVSAQNFAGSPSYVSFTATNGQSTYPVIYDAGLPVIISVNGFTLDPADFDATNGTSIDFVVPLALGDEVAIHFYYIATSAPNLGAVQQHILPASDVQFNLGSETHRFKDLYLSGNTLHLGQTAISVDNEGGLVTSVGGEEVAVGGGGVTTYTLVSELPVAGELGDMAYVTENQRVYLWNGTVWFHVLTAESPNTAPFFTQQAKGGYILPTDGSTLSLTFNAQDPEGTSITWGYTVTGGNLGNSATIAFNNNVAVITPSTDINDAGEFEITFTASDGLNVANSNPVFFTLYFTYDWANATWFSTVQEADSQDYAMWGSSVDIENNKLIAASSCNQSSTYFNRGIISIWDVSGTTPQREFLYEFSDIASTIGSSPNPSWTPNSSTGAYPFGKVKIAGDWAFAGWAMGKPPNNGADIFGIVIIFKKTAGVWAYHSYIASPRAGNQNEGAYYFGFDLDVSIQHNWLVVGSPDVDYMAGNEGAFDFFRYNSSTDTWDHYQHLALDWPVDTGSYSSPNFGAHLSLDKTDGEWVASVCSQSNNNIYGILILLKFDTPSQQWIWSSTLSRYTNSSFVPDRASHVEFVGDYIIMMGESSQERPYTILELDKYTGTLTRVTGSQFEQVAAASATDWSDLSTGQYGGFNSLDAYSDGTHIHLFAGLQQFQAIYYVKHPIGTSTAQAVTRILYTDTSLFPSGGGRIGESIAVDPVSGKWAIGAFQNAGTGGTYRGCVYIHRATS